MRWVVSAAVVVVLAVAGTSLAIHARSRYRATPPPAEPTPSTPAGSTTTTIVDAGMVVTGPNAVIDATFDGRRRRATKTKKQAT